LYLSVTEESQHSVAAAAAAAATAAVTGAIGAPEASPLVGGRALSMAASFSQQVGLRTDETIVRLL